MDNVAEQQDLNNAIVDDDDFKIKGAASRPQNDDQEGNLTPCIICLQSNPEKAEACPCHHSDFHFLCLRTWLSQRSVCPLCKQTVTTVRYNWHGRSYDTYTVPPIRSAQPNINDDNGHRVARRRALRTQNVPENPSLRRRWRIYNTNGGLYSAHVGSNQFSHYKDFGPDDFRNSTELQRRARTFLRREVEVFADFNLWSSPNLTRRRSLEHLAEYIVAILRWYDIKSGEARNLISDHLADSYSTLLLHELNSWLRSPFSTLNEWDQRVQYPGDNNSTGLGSK